MILSDTKKRVKKQDKSSLLVGILLLCLVAFLGINFFVAKEKEANDKPVGVFCSAETMKDGFFVKNGNQFGGIEGQSERHPHTGKYSCRLTDKNRFGLIYTTTNFVKGGKYKATVWEYTETTKGFLTVEGNEGSGLKIIEKVPVEQKNGFARLQIIFKIPNNENMDTLKVYAGVEKISAPVCFDDLQLELLQSKTEENYFQPDSITIQISEKAYRDFNTQKWKAIKEGLLFSGDDDRVEGLWYSKNEGKEIPIKLRLKGDWTDHLKGNKWSFRIKAGKERAWSRMRTFSIQHPSTRGYLKEWLFHKLLAKEDILSPRYDFIKVKMNEKDLGVYAFEEHFGKHLPESQQRREGPIIKLTEDLFWLGMKRQFALQPRGKAIYKNKENAFEGSAIRPFKEGKIQASETLSAQFHTAQTLLHQFKYNTKPASEIFDINRMAKYIAIIDLLGAYHAKFWHNLRFYYNPLSSKLEPVGFDGFGESETRLSNQFVFGYKINTANAGEDLIKLLFQDPIFFSKYMQYLQQFSAPDYLQHFFVDLSKDIEERETYLQTEFTKYTFKKNKFIKRARDIYLLIQPNAEKSVHARIQNKEKGQSALKVLNTHAFPIELQGYGYKKEKMSTTFSKAVFVFSKPEKDLPKYIDIQVPNKAKYLFYTVAGLDSLHVADIVDWPMAKEITQAQLMFGDSLQSNAIYEVVGNKVLFKKGSHVTTVNIEIPAAYRVFFEAGVHLDLQKNAAFISKSPVFMLGTAENGIRIFSSDRTGNGFTVLQTHERSTINYTQFDQLNTFNKGGWTLTGAVTFFEADVTLSNTIFSQNYCEDALNIVHADFILSDALVMNTFSDGFDADFCTGKVKNVVFRATGNDAMDFSGSVITVRGVKVFDAGDKGLSVGENSQVHLVYAKIIGANTGLAAKDLSTLKVDNVYLENCIKGFAVYQKKPEYGKANIIVKKYTAKKIKHLHVLDKGSVLDLMGKKYTGEI